MLLRRLEMMITQQNSSGHERLESSADNSCDKLWGFGFIAMLGRSCSSVSA
jgi:hypothetical protein